MNNKKMPTNFIILALLPVFLWSCVTEEQQVQESKPQEVEPEPEAPPAGPKPEQKAIAAPISPELVEQFPHLFGFEGEVLVGNTRFHAVLAGVPLARGKNRPYKGIHAVYRYSGNKWQRLRIWDSLSFERQLTEKQYFTAVGLNVENNADHSIATIFFAPIGEKKPQINLKLHVFADKDWIVIENTASDLSKEIAPYWTARWSSLFGEQIVQVETDSESSALLRYFEDESVAYVGPIEPSAQIKLLPVSSFKVFDASSSESNVSHFFIGQQETKDFPLRAALHKKCLNSFKVTGGKYAMFKKINMASYVECFENGAAASNTLRVLNEQNVATRNFVLNDRSNKVNYLYLPSESQVAISDQRQSSVQFEGVISSRRTPMVETKLAQEVRLIHREQGVGRVMAPDSENWQGATLVRLQSHIAPNAVRLEPEWSARPLGVNLWEIGSWPLEAKLTTGYYRLEAYNLQRNETCNAVFEVKKEATTEVICRLRSVGPQAGFAANLEIPQFLHKISNYTDRNAYQLPPVGASPELKTIWATSREHRLKLRVFPVDKKVIGDWLQFKNEHPNDTDFNLLGQFSIRLGDRVTRELMCPHSLSSEVAYLAAIRRSRPNALQVFGCENLDFSSVKAIEVARKLNGVVPLIMPATDNNPLLPLSGFSSFVVTDVNPVKNLIIPDDTLQALSHESRYTLSRGAVLRVNTPITNYITATEDETSVSFDLEIKAIWPFKVTGLEVAYSDGQSNVRNLEIQTGEYAITKFRVVVQPGAKWLQLNFLGRIVEQYPGLKNLYESDRIIASSAPFIVTPSTELNN